MLHAKYQASDPSGFEEDFLDSFMYFYCLNLGLPGAGPSGILGPSFAQTW